MPTKLDDIAYYRRRIARCAELAAQATCPSTRFVHEELARLYGEKLKALSLKHAPQMEGDDVAVVEEVAQAAWRAGPYSQRTSE